MIKQHKERIKAEQDYKCGCCQQQFPSKELEIHHIKFRSNGGQDNDENLIGLCNGCHRTTHRFPNELTKWYYQLAKARIQKNNPYIGGLEYELHI